MRKNNPLIPHYPPNYFSSLLHQILLLPRTTVILSALHIPPNCIIPLLYKILLLPRTPPFLPALHIPLPIETPLPLETPCHFNVSSAATSAIFVLNALTYLPPLFLIFSHSLMPHSPQIDSPFQMFGFRHIDSPF